MHLDFVKKGYPQESIQELINSTSLNDMSEKVKSIIIILLISICQAAWGDVEINEVNFPDANFRKWILSQPYGKDGILTEKEIADIMDIKAVWADIHDVKGIEYFTALETLDLDRNQLKSIDVSKNKDLAYLRVGWNQLTSLDISKNKAMRFLFCGGNRLTRLDASGCTALEWIRCWQNQLNGAAVDSLIKNLPTVTKANLFIMLETNERNAMTTAQVAAAKAKGWLPQQVEGKGWKDYAGNEPLPIVIVDDKADNGASAVVSQYVFPEEVKPLIKTQWGQHYPFNLLCPETDKSNEENPYKLAGCGPVAMAQVVNYHRYPSMSPDGQYEYDWSLMFNTLNANVQKKGIVAVAKLISDCGVSSFTEYGDDASSTFLDFAMGAMKRLFGYSNEMSIYNRSDFLTPKRDSLYRQLIFSELKAGRPILYRGTNKEGYGHLFIIDGCKKEKVHVNMGWAGDGNGYYDLNDLGGYSQQHWMLVDVADSSYQATTKEVNINEAGTLVKLLTPEERLTTRHIKLKGKMNGIDFFTLQEMLKKGLLRTVNMEEVEIEALPDTSFSKCYYVSHFVAPRTLKRIGYYSFAHCSNLNYAVFHDGLQEVGNGAFSGCRNLLAVRLPETTTRIGYNAYTSCNTLLSVTIPEGVLEIGNYAFSYCKHLYAINLPKSLRKIGKDVFKDCNRLKYIRTDSDNPFFTINEKKELVETGK